MRLWYLDNEYSDYVIVAETRDEAWTKLREKEGILPPVPEHWVNMTGVDDAGMAEDGLTNAYHDIFEVSDETMIDNPHDLGFVL